MVLSIVISASVCLLVCLPVCLFVCLSQFHRIFCSRYVWPWLGSPLTAIRYVMYFRILWTTSCFHIIEQMGRIRDDAYVSSSSPPGGIGDEVCRHRLHLVLFCQFFFGWPVFSGRELTFTFANCRRNSVCCLSVVCDVGAPYSGGWTFRQFSLPYDSPGTLLLWCQK